MKRTLRLIAILLMLASLLVLIPSGVIVAQAEILEYKLTDKAGVKLQKDGYLFEENAKEPYGYEDPSVSVSIERGRIFETDYVVARVKIANATQLRTMMASGYYSPSTLMGTSMANKANAALAINGDFFSSRNGVGYVARQGKVYRTRCNGIYDVLIIDDQGDMHILKEATNEDINAFQGTVVNGFTFGPGLIINGEPQTGFGERPNAKENAANIAAQRMCLAQVGPLEYLCIASEGPEDPGSVGLTLDQFAELVATFEDIQNAYNLDGGSSTTMVFNRDKINSPNNPKRRPLCDIIYFASAYQPDK